MNALEFDRLVQKYQSLVYTICHQLVPDEGDAQDLAQETIDVEAEGESGTIAFNYHYIFGCLNALSKEKEITLELKSYSQAGIFKSYDKINYLYLVMPVRI